MRISILMLFTLLTMEMKQERFTCSFGFTGEGQYMAFGLSGATDRSAMVNADVFVVSLFMNGSITVTDYFLSSYQQVSPAWKVQFVVVVVNCCCCCCCYYYYTPRFNEVERGVYWYHLVRLSVCPSVDRIVSALYLQQYSSDAFHICTSYQATSEGVSRVMSRFKIQKFEILAIF